MRFAKILLLLLVTVDVVGQGVIPRPQKVEYIDGNFQLDSLKFIVYGNDGFKELAHFINSELFGNRLEIKKSINYYESNVLHLSLIKNDKLIDNYNLLVRPNYIDLVGTNNGIFNAAMTLKQLMFQNKNIIKCQQITDNATFRWRGMHLDVCRHFFSVEFVKKYIDILALHKMNTFHWHLTEDQGWRIEIKKYPKLTQIGSKRKETIIGKNFDPYKGDGKPYGGFYTQEEIKEVVAYAKERFITVIPEIEMPGHAVAALGAYPQYSCRQQPLEILTKWGISDDIYCSKDSTFEFLFDILDEVLELFPSKYIHIGGDEALKTRWKKCTYCQANIKKHGLKDEHELQSYFIGRIDSFLTSRGRKTIGWDEILEGGLAENAAVMSWRGEKGGIAAAKQKHNVVMSPGSHCYFDHYQGDKKTEPLAIGGYTPLKKVHSYNPIPKGLDKKYSKYILGAQGNVWTEYMESPEHVMYMALPRLCALSEVLWSGPGKNSYHDFTNRLIPHFDLLDALDYNYSKSLFNIEARSSFLNGGLNIKLKSDFPEYEIRYTTNGTIPDSKSIKYTNPIQLHKSIMLQASLFRGNKQKGNIFRQQYTINLATAKEIKLKNPPSDHYSYAGKIALVNGIVGSLPWSGNEWLGWRGQVMNASIDLGELKQISKVKISFLKAKESWIHLPEKVLVWIQDGTSTNRPIELTKWDDSYVVEGDIDILGRYIEVEAIPVKIIPEGNPGAGEKPWLFCSEIIIE